MKVFSIIMILILVSQWRKLHYILKAVTLGLCISALYDVETSENKLLFYFEEPARCWEEALPLGNGRLGIMSDGGIEKENIVLNDITLWSGKIADYSNPKAKDALPEIQQLLLEGKNHEAQELVYKTFTCSNNGSNWGNGANANFGCFQTLGNIEIEYLYDSDIKDRSYTRKLDLNKAVATTEFETDNAKFHREYFVSRDSDVAVIHLDADKSNMISVDINLSRQERVDYLTEDNSIVMFGQLND